VSGVVRGASPPFSGIVVGRQDLGETDRIVRLLTPERGRVSVVARGARAARSAWAVLDVGARVRVATRPSRGGLPPIVLADVEDPRVHVRGSLGLLALAQYACEVCGALAREEQPEPKLYGLLETALLLLDALEGEPGGAFRAGLEVKALTFAGVAPGLTRCVACVEPADEEMAFYPAGGGLRHLRCAGPEDGPGRRVASALLHALEHARRAPLRELVDVGLPGAGAHLLADAVEAQLGRPLAARPVLDVILAAP
jgi:DNA repair protein RecO (recombination protein O)